MNRQVLFLHGAGEGGYEGDKPLAASLQTNLGDGYLVHSPEIHIDEAAPDFGWPKQIGKKITQADDGLILVGHSFGASMLLKYLSENTVNRKIAGIFLLAAPFWSGDEAWKAGFKLKPDFAGKIPVDVPMFLYQCKDDDEVPISHFYRYKQQLTQAKFREIQSGGHQFDNNLAIVAEDIRSL